MKFKKLFLVFISFLTVSICYFFIDRQFALWLYIHKLYQIRVFYWFTYLPNVIAYGSIILFLPYFLGSTIQKIKKWQKALFIVSLNMYMAVILSHTLKFILGRSDPKQFIATIFSHKVSTYGFHIFHTGFGDMPSGHTAAIFAATTLIWQIYPHLRWLCILLCVAVIAGLLAMNDHFLGGCLAGAFVGIFIGTCSKYFFFTMQENK